MPSAFLLFLLLQSVLAQEQWRLVHQDGSIEAVWGTPRLSAEQRSGLQSAWVWSGEQAPRRIETERIGKRELPRDSAKLEVRVARQSRSRPPSDLRVIAGPISMWGDLPESALPAWPVPASGRLVLPHAPAERWRLRVAGQGEGTWWIDVPPGSSEVVLSPGTADDVRIEVVAADGAAVGLISASLLEGEPRSGGQRAWTSVRSEHGQIEIPALPDRETVTLSVFAGDHAPAVVQGRPPDLPRRLRLPAGGTLSGQLVDAKGKPVAGAAVRIESWVSPPVTQVVSFHGKSNEDGLWSVTGISPGPAALQIEVSGFAPFHEPVEVEPGRVDLGLRQLQPGVRLSVLVVDDEGSPIPGAEVQTSGVTATSDTRGMAVLSGLPPAPAEIKGTARGHREGKARINPPFAAPARLELRRATTLIGRLVDETGQPIPDGSIQVTQQSCFSEHKVDGDGRFELDLPSGEALELVLRSPRALEIRLREEPGTPGEVRDLGDLIARSGLTVSGRVVSPQSLPVPGARVWLPRTGSDGPVLSWARRDLLQAVTDPDGRFRLTGLSPGPTFLRVDAAGFARSHVDLTLAAEPPGIDAGDVRLSEGSNLLVLAESAPDGSLARADLRSLWLDLDFVTAEIREGEASFRHLPPGEVTVSILAGHKLLCERVVDLAEGSNQEVACERDPMAVHGTVRVGGVPAGPGILSWQPPGTRSPSRIDNQLSPGGLRQQQVFGMGRPQVDVTVGEDGSFSTGELGPGAWKVLWQPAAGSATGQREVEIPRTERAEVLVDFPGLMLTGVVFGEDGEPAAGARVRELGSGALAFSAADGSFRLSGPEGADRISVQAEHQGLTSLEVEVALETGRAPDPVRLTLERRSPPRIETLVVDREGVPVAGAFVFLEEEGRGFRIVTTDGDGRAAAAMTPPYPARVRLAATSGAIWSLGGWVAWDDARSGLTVSLRGSGSIEILGDLAGTPRILSPTGWDVAALLASLGMPPTLSPGVPLRVDGLPPGVYTIAVASSNLTVSARAGEVTEARIDLD
jgi:hypothetical protein